MQMERMHEIFCADVAKVEYWGTDYIFWGRVVGGVFLVEWEDNDNVEGAVKVGRG